MCLVCFELDMLGLNDYVHTLDILLLGSPDFCRSQKVLKSYPRYKN